MNKIEEIVYHSLYKHPTIKLLVRNLYQGLFDLMPRKSEFISQAYDLKRGFFFGFHDVSPFSNDESKVLAQKLDFDFRMPKVDEGIDVGFFDFANDKLGQFHKIGKTYAWNYHKGCRAQWLDDNHIIYNTAKKGKIISIIYNISNKSDRELPYPIDTAYYKNEKEAFATTFSYERLQNCMPGYGYPYSDESFLDQKIPSGTGLFLMNLNTGLKELIVPISKLVDNFCDDDPSKYYHYVTHTEFSHDGRYVSFLYRRKIEGGDINRRITMMMVYDRSSKELILLPTQVSGSHYVWNHKNQIIASCILNGRSCHALYDLSDLNNPMIIAPDILNQDGHQSFITDNVFITDTYPDKWRQVQLYKANIETGIVEKILSINSPKKFMSKTVYNYIDCDLHPRVSSSGNYVCCDTVNTGERSIFIMKLDH